MSLLEQLRSEMQNTPVSGVFCPAYFKVKGYRAGKRTTPAGRRADGIKALFGLPTPYIYQNDLIVGSTRPLFTSVPNEELAAAMEEVATNYPERRFSTNFDHFAPDYETVLAIGIGGLLDKIADSERLHANDASALEMLDAMRVTLHALRDLLYAYAAHAEALLGKEGYDDARLLAIKERCARVATKPPTTFAEGLQLVWMIHTCFLYEGRYAMALGRLDRYLYSLYQKDLAAGHITREDARELFENALLKICEKRFYRRGDDVVNICIGGVDREGNCAVNDLSLALVHAVKNIRMPGPNLSARITPDTPDEFLDECLKSIGTGLGYPALMNDEVNMAALRRYGYAEEDVRNYCMVGCIENFITGMQPPWSDDRFDTQRYFEYLMRGGESYDGHRSAICPPSLRSISSMECFMKHLEEQIEEGVKEYVEAFYGRNIIKDPENYTSPFLSCFCRDCIEKGKDVNMGGAKYPSVHGAGVMGVGTLSDALSAIERVVFCDKAATLEEVAAAMKADFEGYEALHEKLLAAPKYGNNDDFADKYAVWFTSFLAECFDKYRTPDGGGIYVAMATNTANIGAGHHTGATPDGRLAGVPLSDAASPTYGRDVKGATSTILSVSKPDYTRSACGTVVNQKYSPTMFTDDEKRKKLLSLIRVYFSRGGQEIQINATSPDVLRDAMEHPEGYGSLVVRVSGFSAYYVTLDRAVQEDILLRTQQG